MLHFVTTSIVSSPLTLSVDRTQQLRLKNILVLLVLLTRLVSLVVLPPDCLVALLAHDIAHNVPPGRHVALHGVALPDVDHRGEEERLAVLAAEIARDDVVEIGEVCFADLVGEKGALVKGKALGTGSGGRAGQWALPCSRRSCWS